MSCEFCDKTLRLLSIEKQGEDAYMSGIPLEDNPHVDDDERLLWAAGWSDSFTSAKLVTTTSALQWVKESIEVIYEILGVEQADAEITKKIKTILDGVNKTMED